MAWIESHQSLLTHRKTARLARRLEISKITAIGHLHALWWWCMDNAPSGNLDDIDIEDIADGAVWESDPAAFIAALVFAGFVDEDQDGHHAIHQWMEYAGKLIEKRTSDAARKRTARLGIAVQRTSSGHPADGAGTVPNRTQPNPTVPNPTGGKGCAAPPPDAAAAAGPSRPPSTPSNVAPGQDEGASTGVASDVDALLDAWETATARKLSAAQRRREAPAARRRPRRIRPIAASGVSRRSLRSRRETTRRAGGKGRLERRQAGADSRWKSW